MLHYVLTILSSKFCIFPRERSWQALLFVEPLFFGLLLNWNFVMHKFAKIWFRFFAISDYQNSYYAIWSEYLKPGFCSYIIILLKFIPVLFAYLDCHRGSTILFWSVLCQSVTLLGPWYSCPFFSGFRISKMVYISLQTIESISTALSCSYLFLRTLWGPWYTSYI
jgi:hypothetical protein